MSQGKSNNAGGLVAAAVVSLWLGGAIAGSTNIPNAFFPVALTIFITILVVWGKAKAAQTRNRQATSRPTPTRAAPRRAEPDPDTSWTAAHLGNTASPASTLTGLSLGGPVASDHVLGGPVAMTPVPQSVLPQPTRSAWSRPSESPASDTHDVHPWPTPEPQPATPFPTPPAARPTTAQQAPRATRDAGPTQRPVTQRPGAKPAPQQPTPAADAPRDDYRPSALTSHLRGSSLFDQPSATASSLFGGH